MSGSAHLDDWSSNVTVLPRPLGARTSPVRPRADQGLSLHALAVRRLRLPAPADLLGLCRPGGGALRLVGGLMDDVGAAAALPALRHAGLDFVPAALPRQRALVYAVALRALARDQSRPAGAHFHRTGRACGVTASIPPGHAYLRSSAGVSTGVNDGRADLSRRRASGLSRRHHRPRHRQGHFALARQAHRRDGARRQARRSHRPDRARRQDRVSRPATTRGRSNSSATTPRTCSPKQCSRCGRAHRSPSAR